MFFRSFVSLAVIGSAIFSCSPRNFNSSSNTLDDSETGADKLRLVEAISSMGMGGSSFWQANKMSTGYTTGLLMSGAVMTIVGVHNLPVGTGKGNAQTVIDAATINIGFAYASIGSGFLITHLGESRRSKALIDKARLFVIFGAFFALEGGAQTYRGLDMVDDNFEKIKKGEEIQAPSRELARSELPYRLAKMSVYVSKSAKDLLSQSSANFKNFVQNTITLVELKKEMRNSEAKIASKASSSVDEQGKILDDDFMQLALLSDYLQSNKANFNSKDFAHQIKIAATLPYDIPMSEFEKQNITDPVARNIFVNRRNFRKIGLM